MCAKVQKHGAACNAALSAFDWQAINPEKDEAHKFRIKGEMVTFILRTARQFATREAVDEGESRINSLSVSGHSKGMFNTRWTRLPFDNDHRPVFTHTSGSTCYYLYFRRKANMWVIDDLIDDQGAVYSKTRNKAGRLAGTWESSSNWTVDQTFRVQMVRATDPGLERVPGMGAATNMTVAKAKKLLSKSHTGQGLWISGGKVEKNRYTADESENGLYVRQPPYDDIHKRPHYIMTQAAYRRHLFWCVKNGCWQIMPQCNDDEGAFAMSQRESITGAWETMPAELPEKDLEMSCRNMEGSIVELHPWDPPMQDAAEPEPEVGEGEGEGEAGAEVGHAEAGAREAAAFEALVPWNASNHECMLFSNASHTVSFLSLNPKKLRDGMHPNLLRHLELNNIRVGQGLDELGASYHAVLSALTEVRRTPKQAAALMGGQYCLTGDNLLKMLAIFVRIRCGIPVVLCGECGCGKTFLITYLCAWLGIELVTLDVHGGTTEAEIVACFERAEAMLRGGTREVFVFLDECNACPHIGLVTEAISMKSVHGRTLSDGVKILAALNPYRRRPERDQTPGLVFQLGNQTTPDPMASLVYRVHPIPSTLQDLIFDFGALPADRERAYIASMVGRVPSLVKSVQDGKQRERVCEIITAMICASQEFVRDREGDRSACSLRDVKRTLHLMTWFMDVMGQRPGKKSKGGRSPQAPPEPQEGRSSRQENMQRSMAPLMTACVMSLAHVYFYRLSEAYNRASYWKTLRECITEECHYHSKGTPFANLGEDGVLEQIVRQQQKGFCKRMVLEDGIAMNEALMENLFVCIVCVLNRIPVFVVGKPGSSKTLTMQVIASNLVGKLSPSAFWRRFPSVYIVQYQCSPMSTADSIQHQCVAAVSCPSPPPFPSPRLGALPPARRRRRPPDLASRAPGCSSVPPDAVLASPVLAAGTRWPSITRSTRRTPSSCCCSTRWAWRSTRPTCRSRCCTASSSTRPWPSSGSRTGYSTPPR